MDRFLSPNYFPKTTVGFVRWTVTKMAAKMTTACHFALVDTLTWSFITRFLPNFMYRLHSSNYCPNSNMGLSNERLPRWPPKWLPVSLHLWTLQLTCSHLSPDFFRNFIYRLLFSISRPGLNMGVVR